MLESSFVLRCIYLLPWFIMAIAVASFSTINSLTILTTFSYVATQFISLISLSIPHILLVEFFNGFHSRFVSWFWSYHAVTTVTVQIYSVISCRIFFSVMTSLPCDKNFTNLTSYLTWQIPTCSISWFSNLVFFTNAFANTSVFMHVWFITKQNNLSAI